MMQPLPDSIVLPDPAAIRPDSHDDFKRLALLLDDV
jgi:hypothetical protein